MQLWWRLVEFGFWLLYQPLAFTYDAVSWVVSLGAWREWTRASLRFADRSAGRVLELAHGTGNLQCDLAARGYDAIGYDVSAQMGRIAAGKLRRAGHPVRLIRGRAQALPFPDGAFATVISTFPTNFISDPRTLAEIRRVLTPEGVLIIVPGAAFTGGGLARRVLEWAYRITGQRTGDAAEASAGAAAFLDDTFTPHGFRAALHTVDCPRSRAFVIVARKAESEGNQP